jgi:hypothetical protein
MIKIIQFSVVASLASGTSARSQSVFLTYDQWEQLPTSLRQIYISGVFDTVSTITVAEGVISAQHYNNCIVQLRMNLAQIAEGTKKLVEVHSDLRQKPAPHTIMMYLISLCGLPMPNEGARSNGRSSVD